MQRHLVPIKDTFVAKGMCRVAFESHPLSLGEIINADITNPVPAHLGKKDAGVDRYSLFSKTL